MSEDANISDNNSSPEVLGAAVRRRPGRPKGLPKPAGSGRQPGTPNRVGKEARELADKFTPNAFKRLGQLANHPDPKVAILAIQQILDRRYGKPMAPSEIGGPGGTPLIPAPEMSDTELACLLAFKLTAALAPQDRRTLREPYDAPPALVAPPERAETQEVEHAPGYAERQAMTPEEIAAEREEQLAQARIERQCQRAGANRNVVRFNPNRR